MTLARTTDRLEQSSSTFSGSYATATYVVLFIGTAAVAVAFVCGVDVTWCLLIPALLCGWSEVDGRCGASHVCAITPLRAMGVPRLWLKAVSAYTLAGSATAAGVGAALGAVGKAFIPAGAHASTGPHVAPILATLAGVLAARELGWLKFRLPEVPRQTHKMWFAQFGFVTAAGMWGAHIGLGAATVIKHGGLFMVAALALVLGPMKGSVLMLAFWLGRALPIWSTPLLDLAHHDASQLSERLHVASDAYRHIAAVALLLMGALLLIG